MVTTGLLVLAPAEEFRRVPVWEVAFYEHPVGTRHLQRYLSSSYLTPRCFAVEATEVRGQTP